MNKKTKVIFWIIVFIIVSLLLSVIIINSIKNPDTYLEKHDSHTILLSYLSLIITQTIFPIIPGEPIELLGGYLFGKYLGTIICFIGESIASILIILLTKKFGQRIIQILFKKSIINKLKTYINKKTFIIFSILYIMPGTPKDILCYVSGMAKFKTIPLLIISTIGRIPSICTSTISAGLFQEDKYFLSVFIYIVTIVVCFIDLLIYNRIIKKHN